MSEVSETTETKHAQQEAHVTQRVKYHGRNGKRHQSKCKITDYSHVTRILKAYLPICQEGGILSLLSCNNVLSLLQNVLNRKEQPDSQLDLGAVISSYSPTRIRGRSAPCFPQSSTPEMCFRKNMQMDI